MTSNPPAFSGKRILLTMICSIRSSHPKKKRQHSINNVVELLCVLCLFWCRAVCSAFASPELQTVLPKRVLELGYDEWRWLSRRCCRAAINVSQVLQFGREPDSFSPHRQNLPHMPEQMPQAPRTALLETDSHRVSPAAPWRGCELAPPANKLAKLVPSVGHHRLAPAPNPVLMSQAMKTFVGQQPSSRVTSTRPLGPIFTVITKLVSPSLSRSLSLWHLPKFQSET